MMTPMLFSPMGTPRDLLDGPVREPPLAHRARGHAAASTRIRSYCSEGTGTASAVPRSLRCTRNVSGENHAAAAPINVMTTHAPPIFSGTLVDPGGATRANTVGRK